MRTAFLDNIRIALTALVIFHHTAITFGAPGAWYLHEITWDGGTGVLQLLLMFFVAVNQSFFMGFFFLIAGYFTPGSLEKKGSARFIWDRFTRLGIPLLIYGFLIGPATIAIVRSSGGGSFFESLISIMKQVKFSTGPMWFVQALLIFAVVHVILSLIWKDTGKRPHEFPSGKAILLSVFLVAGVAFLIRLIVPVGREVLGMQIGYFASYAFLFFAGCFAWNSRLLEKVEFRRITPCLITALVALLIYPFVVVSMGIEGFSGGLNINAAIYALWEPLAGFGIILFMLWFFRKRLNNAGRISRWLSRRAYAVYIIHPPVVVGASMALHAWVCPVLVKIAVVGSLACACCLAVSSLLLLIPCAEKVL